MSRKGCPIKETPSFLGIEGCQSIKKASRSPSTINLSLFCYNPPSSNNWQSKWGRMPLWSQQEVVKCSQILLHSLSGQTRRRWRCGLLQQRTRESLNAKCRQAPSWVSSFVLRFWVGAWWEKDVILYFWGETMMMMTKTWHRWVLSLTPGNPPSSLCVNIWTALPAGVHDDEDDDDHDHAEDTNFFTPSFSFP